MKCPCGVEARWTAIRKLLKLDGTYLFYRRHTACGLAVEVDMKVAISSKLTATA